MISDRGHSSPNRSYVRGLAIRARHKRTMPAIALPEEARVIELPPRPPDGADWLAYVGGKVVGRAALPSQAVRTVEAALG